MLHRLFLDRLIPKGWADEHPPILLNSWEAKYFDVNHQNIVEMAVQVKHVIQIPDKLCPHYMHKIRLFVKVVKQASGVGIDLIVLDDGWFGQRNDDMSSLGDW